MSRSNDPGHFFQSEAALATEARKSAKRERGDKAGEPVQLPSKVLAVLADPADESAVYVAESGGVARRIRLDAPELKDQQVFRGPTAPLTCLALTPAPLTPPTARSSLQASTVQPTHLFAGCWDKCIHSWTLPSASPASRTSSHPHPHKRYVGHTDFVKCLATARLPLGGMAGDQALISGSADATIIVWSILSGQKVHVLKGHVRGVLSLLVDPFLTDWTVDAKVESMAMWSAGSTGEILRWKLSKERGELLDETVPGTPEASTVNAGAPASLSVHETSVNKITLASETDAEEADIFTASSDNTVKHLARNSKPPFAVESTFQHPDFVRDVVVDLEKNLVVTACRDEDVRVWDISSGELVATYSGHWEEVTGLALARFEGSRVVVSVGIDGTLRRWSLEKADLDKERRRIELQEAGEDAVGVEGQAVAEERKSDKVDAPPKQKIELTEDEERELAELMDDSDDD